MASTTDPNKPGTGLHGEGALDELTDTGGSDSYATEERHGLVTGEFDREINLRAILWSGFWLAVVTIVANVLMWYFLRGFQLYDQRHEVPDPPRRAVASGCCDDEHSEPDGARRRQCVWPSFDARPRDSGQYREHDACRYGHGAAAELSTEHHDACGRRPDRQATGQPNPELGGREDREPAVHQQVVQPVYGVDVAKQTPELRHRAGSRRDRRGLVEPQRRTRCARRAQQRRERRDRQRVEPARGEGARRAGTFELAGT